MDKIFEILDMNLEAFAHKFRRWLAIININISYNTIDEAFDSIYYTFQLTGLLIFQRTKDNGILKYTATKMTAKQILIFIGKFYLFGQWCANLPPPTGHRQVVSQSRPDLTNKEEENGISHRNIINV